MVIFLKKIPWTILLGTSIFSKMANLPNNSLLSHQF
jgi:hypothetical protein